MVDDEFRVDVLECVVGGDGSRRNNCVGARDAGVVDNGSSGTQVDCSEGGGRGEYGLVLVLYETGCNVSEFRIRLVDLAGLVFRGDRDFWFADDQWASHGGTRLNIRISWSCGGHVHLSGLQDGERGPIVEGVPITVAFAVDGGDFGRIENFFVNPYVVQDTLVLVPGRPIQRHTESKGGIAFGGGPSGALSFGCDLFTVLVQFGVTGAGVEGGDHVEPVAGDELRNG